MKNIFTVDLEDWYCSRALEGFVLRSHWHDYQCRIAIGTHRILDLLRRHNIRATFFILGFVAERNPDIIRRIADDGHELASHGYYHQHLEDMDAVMLEQDLDRALSATARAVSADVRGYRAPMFSITANTSSWALDVLQKLGIGYDSSVFPLKIHPEYGMSGVPMTPYKHSNGLMELPMSCVTVAGKRIPVGGGGYFRQFPYRVTRSLMRKCNREGRSVMFYIHPWELDTEQPRVKLPILRALRHYRGMHTMFSKIEQLVQDFQFDSIQSVFDDAATSDRFRQ